MARETDPTAKMGAILVKICRARGGEKNPEFTRDHVAAAWAASLARRNLGDSVARFLLSNLLPQKIVQVPLRMPGKLLSVGSVLDRALPGDICWGTGTLSDKRLLLPGVEILAVRGPRTASLVRETAVPNIYGDPALLLPKLFMPKQGKKFSLSVVPHYMDFASVKSNWRPDRSTTLVDVSRLSWRTAVEEIVSSEVVISSSLHGLIIAEAYGVPAVWVTFSDQVVGGVHKFLDYYEGTGRSDSPITGKISLNKIAEMASSPPIFDTSRLGQALRLRL